MLRTSHKLQITLATAICNEGDLYVLGMLTHPQFSIKNLGKAIAKPQIYKYPYESRCRLYRFQQKGRVFFLV